MLSTWVLVDLNCLWGTFLLLVSIVAASWHSYLCGLEAGRAEVNVAPEDE